MFLPTGNLLTRAKAVPGLFTKEMDDWMERRSGGCFSDPVAWFLSGSILIKICMSLVIPFAWLQRNWRLSKTVMLGKQVVTQNLYGWK